MIVFTFAERRYPGYMRHQRSKIQILLALLLICSPFQPYSVARAADHRDAPAVDGAGEGDLTDVFAFLDPNDAQRVVFIMGVNPFANPTMPQTYRFSPDYLYQFKVDVDGDYREDFVIQATFAEEADLTQRIEVRVGVPDPSQVGATNKMFTRDPITGALGRILGDDPDIKIFAGLRDDPFVFDGAQFFRILGGDPGFIP